MLQKDAPSFKAAESLPAEYESAVRKFVRPAPKGVQYFTKVEDGQVVGAPERHMAADLQVGRHPHVFTHRPFSHILWE